MNKIKLNWQKIFKRLLKKGLEEKRANEVVKIAQNSSNPEFILWHWGIKSLLILILTALTTPASAATPRETRIIAIVLAAEAGGEGARGLQAVANVINNRARKQHKTPYQIVTQRNQFYGLTARNRLALYASVREEADRLAANIESLPDITGGALYFRTARERVFPWCKSFIIKINHHYFYK